MKKPASWYDKQKWNNKPDKASNTYLQSYHFKI